MTAIDIKALREAASNGRFIALASPDTVLALLDRLVATEDRVKKLDAEANRYVNDMLDACKERDAFEEALAAKTAECERLRTALEPFAKIASEYSDSESDDHQVWKDFDVLVAALPLRIFRDAREALATKETGNG